MSDTNAGSKLFISTETVPEDIAVEGVGGDDGYEDLTWVEIKNVGSVGELGVTQGMVTYDTWDTEVALKAKGIADAGDPEVELSPLPGDAGQVALRAAAATNFNYGFKIERNDAPAEGFTNTVEYFRGLVSGPRRSNGRNEDFVTETYTIGNQQRPIIVEPAVIPD